MKKFGSIGLIAAIMVAATAMVSAQEAEVILPGFTVSLSGSAPAAKGHTETFSRLVTVGESVEVNARAISSVARQGKTLGVITVTVGDESTTAPLANGAAQVIVPGSGERQVVVTVTLSAFVGLGSATISVDDVYLTVR